MIRAYQSEWLKIRRPAMLLGGAGTMIGFAALAIVLSLSRLGSKNGGSDLTAAILSHSDGFAQLMALSANFIGVVSLSVFAIAVGMEYGNGTLHNLLLREPKRLQLLAGKLLALGSLVTVAALLATVVALLTAVIVAPHYGVSTSSWFQAAGVRSLLSVGGNLVLATLAWGVIGAVLAVVLRSTAVPVALGFAYALPVENLLVAAWPGGKQWLPGQLIDAVAQGGTSTVSYASAMALVGCYLLIALAATAILFRRRDVTV